ncbi:MAG: hypothetical protein U5L72_10400 [Bacteroidales bacterium]|nr:hypothetical protein [Bacteroidales bacterium]MDZ7634792.1 hypothetical protein [Bacteroidales bacterium]
MGYDLHCRTADFRFGICDFPKVLKLALCFDWIPKGTIEWDDEKNCEKVGGYLYNEYQYVTPEDAFELAEALERALEQLPELNSTGEPMRYPRTLVIGDEPFGTIVRGIFAESEMGLYIPDQEERSRLLYEFGNKDDRDYLREFVAFCRIGTGFTIS